MSATFTTPVDLTGNELQNAIVQVLASAPTNVQGRIYYDSVLDNLRVGDGTTWTDLEAGGTNTEAVQDIVGAMLGGTVVTATYNDGAGTVTLTIGAGQIVDSMVSGSAAINADKIVDGTTNHVFTAADDTKLTGISSGANVYTDADALDIRLDQFAAPNTSVTLNSQKITNLLDPTNPQDAATKAYVDGVASGLDVKASVRVATTANGTLASAFENGDTIDGVALVTGNRILIKNQSSGAENGIYTVNASGAPTRATDFDSSAEVTGGAFVFVEQGTVNADSGWVVTNDGAITVGSTALTFAQFSGAGQIIAGDGITKSGNTLNVAAGFGLTFNVGILDVNTSVIARRYSALIGDGVTTSIVVTHSLNTRSVVVDVSRATTPWDMVYCDIRKTSVNTITIVFATAPTSNQYTVTVVG